MHPILFKLGPLTIYSYGVALAIAFLLVVWLARRATARSLRGLVPMSEQALVDWAVWTVVGGILGGRLFYVLVNWESYATQPHEIFALWHGGLVWYGGFLGGVLATWLYLRTYGYPFLRGADQVMPFVAVGHAVGRIGCFANGCCYGKPTVAWFGVQFPGQPHPVVPTQLIESASLFVLYLILRRLQTPPILRRQGLVFGVYLIGYALIRFWLEFWRGDQPVIWNGLTMHQLISFALLLIGVGLMGKSGDQGSRNFGCGRRRTI